MDDGTPDNSGKICDEYASRDSRIHVFHKENGGVSSARNLGLDNAKGEWVTFVDSDDTIESNLLSTVYEKVQNHSVGLILFSYQRVLMNGNVRKNTVKDGMQQSMDLFKSHYVAGLWAYAYKKSLLDKYEIRFPKGIPFSEDQCFNCKYILHNITTATCSNIFYNYIENEGSATSYELSLPHIECNIRVAVELSKYVHSHPEIKKTDAYPVIMMFIHDYCGYLLRVKDLDFKQAQRNFRKYYKQIVASAPYILKCSRYILAYISLKLYLAILSHK